jgi:hypothetical protein
MCIDPQGSATQDHLFDRLDPERDYGDRTFAEIHRLMRAGALRLLRGDALPVIQETATGRLIAGSAGKSSSEIKRMLSRGIDAAHLPLMRLAGDTGSVVGSARTKSDFSDAQADASRRRPNRGRRINDYRVSTNSRGDF